MKKQHMFLCMLLAAFAFQGCGGNDTPKDPVEKVEERNEELSTMKEDDTEFMVKAAAEGMLEVQLGQLAEKRAGDQRVKDFGAMMVRDHSKANEQLKALASNKNVALPLGLGEEQQKHVTDLMKRQGANFDKAYISMMVDDHQGDIKEFEDASKNATDADVKAFATSTLPVLRSHLEAAKSINDNAKK